MYQLSRRSLFMAVMLYAYGPASACVGAQPLTDQVVELLRARIETAGTPPGIAVGEEVIYASEVLPRFYELRAYRPAWSGNDGLLSDVEHLFKGIREADREGLIPSDYHIEKIEAILAEESNAGMVESPMNPNILVDLDLLLTDAFLIYGSHLLAGRVNPETIDPEWRANRREADLAELLESALSTNHVEETLQSLLPPQPGYGRLRDALKRYREMAAGGGWPRVPNGPKLQKGDRGERVQSLRARLVATGDLAKGLIVDGDAFDDTLDEAVRLFQGRHGLDVDGVVGSATLAALNVSVEDRLSQIELNMERWRWLPQDLGQRHILINIANFELDVFENGGVVMTMKAVVGRDYRRTPVFSDKMTYIVLNPTWYLPRNIAVQDKLPHILDDPAYLAQQNMRVFQGWGGDAKEIDPESIDWSKITAENFAYRLRQDPGPKNALGRVKFMFPNRFNVYLHDTPSQELFAKATRAFSSGCIRIEKPIDLAEYVLRGDPRWSRESIRAALDRGSEQTVKLPEPIPVHLLYWTSWATEDGTIHFRNDIYGREKQLHEALGEKASISAGL